MDFSEQKYALVHSTTAKIFKNLETRLFGSEEWNEDTFETFLDGERTECSYASENLTIIQTAPENDLLNETLTFCETIKRKKMSTEKIRKMVRPVRGVRRQSLPPVDVSFLF